MSITRRIKQFAKNVLSIHFVNLPLRSFMKTKLMSSMIPHQIRCRIPVVGEISVPLPDGKTLQINNDGNDTIASRMFWMGFDSFEPDTIQLLYKLLPHIRVFFDIGANTGVLSLLAALDDKERKIYAFEPVPWITSAMRKNCMKNGLENVRVESVALADFIGSVDMYIPMDVGFPTGSSTVRGYREASQIIHVPVTTLDAYVVKENIQRVDLLKIDTETTEPAVLLGGMSVLREFSPIIICEVQPDKTEKDLQRVMADLDYHYYHISGSGLVERDVIEGDPTGEFLNWLFLPENRKSDFLDIFTSQVL